MKITDYDIRDKKPSVEVRPPTAAARRLAREGDVTGLILFRVTQNSKAHPTGWWHLDDLSRAVGHRSKGFHPGIGHHWNLIEVETAPFLVAAFDAVGQLHRLQFMAMTDDSEEAS